MSSRFVLLLLLVGSNALVDAGSPAVEDYDVLQYIDPLIGSAEGGNHSQPRAP